MIEHTPGPWEWLNYPGGRKLLSAPDRAVIHCPGPGPEMAISEEDQSLIAAAPALLNALVRYRANEDQMLRPEERPCRCELCRQADEAIAAAKG